MRTEKTLGLDQIFDLIGVKPLYYNYPELSKPLSEDKKSTKVGTNTFYNIKENELEFSINVYIPFTGKISKDNVKAICDSNGISINIVNPEYNSNLNQSNVPEKVYFNFSNNNVNFDLNYTQTIAEIKDSVLQLIVPKNSRSNFIEIRGF